MADLLADAVALSWEQLDALAPDPAERCEGPANAQATLRLFGQSESQVRVTLFRDSFYVLSLGLPSRSFNSPFFFELFAIPSTEFAI